VYKSKLLYVVQLPPPFHGVSSMNAMVVADVQLNKDAEVHVVPMGFARSLEDIDRLNVRKAFRMFTFMAQMASKLVTWKPDVVYFTPVATGPAFIRDLLPMLLWRIAGVTRIYHLHGLGIANKKQVYWRTLYRLAFSGAHVVSISAVMQEQELAWLGPGAIKRHVVPNTIPLDQTGANTGTSVRPTEEASTLVRLLFLSATFPSKGIFVLLKAMEILRARHGQTVQLEIVGDSRREIDDEIRQYVKSRELGDLVVQRGALFGEDKMEAFHRADIFVHPTLRDYFPLVLLEAMQLGLPLVATQVGAINEIVDPDVNGLICRPDDAEDLANAISKLVSSEEKRRQFGAASRERFERHFSRDRFRQNLGEVFRAAGINSHASAS